VPEQVIARPVQDEVIILDTRTNQYLGLNGPGAVVWSVLAEGGSATTAVEELLARYEVTDTMAQADVERLINDLQQLNLITTVS
jgi:hypothetical protein